MTKAALESHFEGKNESVRAIYDRLLAVCRKFGPVVAEPHKTSIHLLRKTAFAGVATRRNYLILTIKSDHAIDSPRVFRCEQTSRSRYHCEVKLEAPSYVSAEIVRWLKAAYELSG